MKKILFRITAFLAVLILLWFCRKAIATATTPFVVAIVFFYLLNPLINFLVRRKVNKTIAAVISIFTLILCVLSLVFIVAPKIIGSINSIIDSLPTIIEKFNNTIKMILSGLSSFGLPQSTQDAMYNQITNAGADTLELFTKTGMTFSDMVNTSISVISTFLVSIVIVYYYFTHSSKIKDTFLMIFPTKYRQNVCCLGHDVDITVRGFLQGQLLAALLVGILEYIGLLIVGVENSLVLAIIGGLANMIPYLGPFIGAIPAVVLSMFDNPTKAIWVILVFIIVQQIDNAFISPKIIEKKIGIHPLVSIFAILIGGELLGIFGMFLSVPVTATLLVLGKRITKIMIRQKGAVRN